MKPQARDESMEHGLSTSESNHVIQTINNDLGDVTDCTHVAYS